MIEKTGDGKSAVLCYCCCCFWCCCCCCCCCCCTDRLSLSRTVPSVVHRETDLRIQLTIKTNKTIAVRSFPICLSITWYVNANKYVGQMSRFVHESSTCRLRVRTSTKGQKHFRWERKTGGAWNGKTHVTHNALYPRRKHGRRVDAICMTVRLKRKSRPTLRKLQIFIYLLVLGNSIKKITTL